MSGLESVISTTLTRGWSFGPTFLLLGLFDFLPRAGDKTATFFISSQAKLPSAEIGTAQFLLGQ